MLQRKMNLPSSSCTWLIVCCTWEEISFLAYHSMKSDYPCLTKSEKKPRRFVLFCFAFFTSADRQSCFLFQQEVTCSELHSATPDSQAAALESPRPQLHTELNLILSENRDQAQGTVGADQRKGRLHGNSKSPMASTTPVAVCTRKKTQEIEFMKDLNSLLLLN